MRDKVKRKLSSQRGASLLMALLYFLVAAMVGAVVLTAAVTNAGRVTRNKADQQTYLAVSSAVLLAQEDLKNATFTAVKTETKKVNQYGVGEGEPTSITIELTGTKICTKDFVENVYNNTQLEPESLEFNSNGRLPTAEGGMSIDNKYNITIELHVKTDNPKAYSTTVTFPASVNTHVTTSSENGENGTKIFTTTTTTTVTWGTSTAAKGAGT